MSMKFYQLCDLLYSSSYVLKTYSNCIILMVIELHYLNGDRTPTPSILLCTRSTTPLKTSTALFLSPLKSFAVTRDFLCQLLSTHWLKFPEHIDFKAFQYQPTFPQLLSQEKTVTAHLYWQLHLLFRMDNIMAHFNGHLRAIVKLNCQTRAREPQKEQMEK